MGTVFDIQRFCVNDGPGIRTSVFLKGCNLHCAWCHNPESVSPAVQSLNGHPCGQEISAAEVLDEVFLDRDFYANSGGGVTITGGEPLLQPAFTQELLKGCKDAGIHTAVDTAGNVDFSVFEQISPYCDLFLFDVKAADCGLHRRGTGSGNTQILHNLQQLDAKKWIRIPIIPGFNDSERELRSIAKLLRSVRTIERICLLPFHTLGFGKYRQLGLANPCAHLIAPAPATVDTYAAYFGDLDAPLQIC